MMHSYSILLPKATVVFIGHEAVAGLDVRRRLDAVSSVGVCAFVFDDFMVPGFDFATFK